MSKKTRRSVQRIFETSEFRSEQTDGGLHLSGYAVVYDEEAEIAGVFREVMRPGSWRKTIGEADIRALWGHSELHPLGRTKNGTLQLAEDSRGVRFELELPDTQLARDLHQLVTRGDVTGMSARFEVITQRWTEYEDELDLREIQEVRAVEISPVTFPAYDLTEVEARDEMAAARGAALSRTPEPEAEGHASTEAPASVPHSREPRDERRSQLRRAKLQLANERKKRWR